MSPDQFFELKKYLVEQTGGSIDLLREDFKKFQEADTKWKADAKPVLDLGNNLSGFGKTLAYILGTVAAIVGLINGLSWVFHHLKD